jgi:BirA family transcriptional regulator, biotin operon repressor / biotin---[acetyl-CoA-carboxylase] ligase
MSRAAVGPAIVRVGRVDSTQSVAFALAADGAPDRTVVLADSQAAGRGRRGRAWLDEPGGSLLVSVLLRPALPPAQLPMLSLAAGLAVADALDEATGVAARLKWPNDVLVDGRKIAGILLESRLGTTPLVVLGIGVNLAQRTFPPILQERATSVVRETGRIVEREAVLAALLRALDRHRDALEHGKLAQVLDGWRARSATLGRTVSVDGVQGIAVDVDDDGALLVDDGTRRRRVVAGEIG